MSSIQLPCPPLTADVRYSDVVEERQGNSRYIFSDLDHTLREKWKFETRHPKSDQDGQREGQEEY